MNNYLLEINPFSHLQVLLLVLAIIGSLIIICCLILFFTNIQIKDKIQEIKLLGAEMRISVITFFVFVGLLLILPVIYTNYITVMADINNSNKQHEKTETELQAKIDQLSRSQSRTVTLYLDLENTDDHDFPKKDQLFVGYTEAGIGSDRLQTLTHFVDFFQGRRRVGIRIDNVRPETEYSTIEVINSRTSEKWVVEGVKPFLPVITLKKQPK